MRTGRLCPCFTKLHRKPGGSGRYCVRHARLYQEADLNSGSVMDTLDVRIFCEMAFKYLDYNRFSERHVSPTKIGQKLGVDEKTVRLRVRKMEGDGFIKYYQAMPNLTLFGLNEICSFMFEAPSIPSKHTAIQHLRKAPLAVEIDDFLGPYVSVGIDAPITSILHRGGFLRIED